MSDWDEAAFARVKLEAEFMRVRKEAIEDCAKVADEHAAEWNSEAITATHPISVDHLASKHRAAVRIAQALRAFK